MPTNFIGSDDRIMVLGTFEFSGHGSHVTMKQPIGTIWMLRDGLITRGFGFFNVNEAVDSMAAQCGRDRTEIESLIDEAERARALSEPGRVSGIAWLHRGASVSAVTTVTRGVVGVRCRAHCT